VGADVEADALQAWSCAANCLQYESDPGPAQVNVGSDMDPVSVSRPDALREAYVRRLVLNLDGDHARILAAGRALEQELTDRVELDEEARRCWRLGVDLCHRAAKVIEEAGADTDDAARQRLLAGVRHRETVDIFGVLPQVRERSAQWLIDALGEIDPPEGPTTGPR
jgi:hypothetical protein